MSPDTVLTGTTLCWLWTKLPRVWYRGSGWHSCVFWMCSSPPELVCSRCVTVNAECSILTQDSHKQGVWNVMKWGRCDGRVSSIVILVHFS
jgi:hypothetical protein